MKNVSVLHPRDLMPKGSNRSLFTINADLVESVGLATDAQYRDPISDYKTASKLSLVEQIPIGSTYVTIFFDYDIYTGGDGNTAGPQQQSDHYAPNNDLSLFEFSDAELGGCSLLGI